MKQHLMYVSLIAMALMVMSCGIFKGKKKDDQGQEETIAAKPSFTLIEATSQRWAGGAPGSGTGTNYNFKIVIETDDPLTFDSLWVDSLVHPMRVRKVVNKKGTDFATGDTVYLSARYTKLDRQFQKSIGEEPPAPPVKVMPPMDVSGIAMIFYKEGTARKYFDVKEMKQLPFIPYP